MTSKRFKILLIDDDTGLCGLLEEYLATEGLLVHSVHDGDQGVHSALSQEFDLVILDVMLPLLSGFEVLRRIRSTSAIPVLMLTARGEDIDRIVGLEMGADDYLPKPFNTRELVARIRAIQRRAFAVPSGPPAAKVLQVDDVSIDLGARTVRCGSSAVEVTSVEFDVLAALVGSAGRVVSREHLSLQALGREINYQDRAIDVHVSNIRRKLGPRPDGDERIKAVRCVGYLYTIPGR